MTASRLYCVFVFGICFTTFSASNFASAQPAEILDGYSPREILGWEVHVSKKLLEDKADKTAQALKLLEGQLEKICEVVPEKAVEKLRQVRIWVSPQYPAARPKAEYHPGKQWLLNNGRPAVMVKSVEITNVDIFERECVRMPMLALHELSHAYHDQCLGFDNAEVQELFEKASDAGIYDSVERWFGPDRENTTEKAYAMSNAREYFAECSEAYFGENDFYPFNAVQLKRHDPDMFALLGELWLVE